MHDWLDDWQDDLNLMLLPIVKKYGLTSGDISPEDTLALVQILTRYVEYNSLQSQMEWPS
jgi:hypothetical protein